LRVLRKSLHPLERPSEQAGPERRHQRQEERATATCNHRQRREEAKGWLLAPAVAHRHDRPRDREAIRRAARAKKRLEDLLHLRRALLEADLPEARRDRLRRRHRPPLRDQLRQPPSLSEWEQASHVGVAVVEGAANQTYQTGQ